MKKIIAFAGSNSSRSINAELVSSVVENIHQHQVRQISLTNYTLPMFDVDIERESGYPNSLRELHTMIRSADGLIISVNEHNGGVSAFFKNVVDWLSRLDRDFLEGKRVLLLSASPGRRGALSALEYTRSVLPRFGATIIASIAFPLFRENFSLEEGKIIDPGLQEQFSKGLDKFLTTG